jgi:S-adenosylmethionine decarboxylase
LQSIGRHLILELWGCDFDLLNSVPGIERAMRETIDASGSRCIDLRVVPFTPQGITGVAVLAESHLVIHTWPEHGYAGAELFVCSPHVDLDKATEVLQRHFRPAHIAVMQLNRGVMPIGGPPGLQGVATCASSPSPSDTAGDKR